jgi:hypothetical protein
MVNLDYASLPSDHPIRRYCKKWDIFNWKAQDALCELIMEVTGDAN